MTKTYSARKALEILRQNNARDWSSGDSSSYKSRIEKGGYFKVDHKAKFKLNITDKVYTVGSCFARNVENVLNQIGVDVVLSGQGLPPDQYKNWDEETQTGGDMHISHGLSARCLNKYDTKTMLQEFQHVLTDKKLKNEGLIELHPGKFFDPLVGIQLGHHPIEKALINRLHLNSLIEKIKLCNVVFITLGLTEGWIDISTGISLNEHPGLRDLMKLGERIHFQDHSYPEVIEALEEMLILIRQHANQEMKFIVSVSPVTLWMTFQETDVVVSNTNSKSILRAAAGALANKYDYVDYFPSYEMVMNSPRNMAFSEDQHHVTKEMVNFIMSVFKAAYFSNEE